ncbi:hypothetical protein CEXT_300841 [Caerostris extrusa]|uniref:Uncharacterized protein n=1 Tax=Caerostris extrusa TaxID=172846 RepID=A0AAV4MQA0_CAEEX|nr:hypothetical protein CEXT_300841 [Caerostris extrusa]
MGASIAECISEKGMRYFYGMHYGGNQDVVDEPDDDDEKIYKCDSVMPPTSYVMEECMYDQPSSQEPSGQETTMVANDEPAQDYDEFDIDLSTPLVIVEDDLPVDIEQTTPSTLDENHKETIPSTET